MKLLQGLIKLKSGIEANDKKEIESAFVLITGEVAQFPDGCSGSCGAYAEMNNALEEENPEDISPYFKDLDLDFTVKKIKKDKPLEAIVQPEPETTIKSEGFENKFNPSVEIEDKEGYNELNDRVKPVPRTRRPHKQSTVFCQNCNKNILVDPLFKKEPYYCDLIKLGQKCPNAK